VSDVERTIRYATAVLDLNAAWSFVMERIESVGPNPTVEISPYWVYSDGEEDVRKFGVVVSGTIREGEEDA
jgi:hypothetical protein